MLRETPDLIKGLDMAKTLTKNLATDLSEDLSTDLAENPTQDLAQDSVVNLAEVAPLSFTIAGASVLGYHHRQFGLNNQDAWDWEQGNWGTIAVVCDGCGSTPYSEVGAQVGVRFGLRSLRELLQQGEDPYNSEFWRNLEARLLQHLRQFADSLGGDALTVLRDYCLFTIVGVVITPKVTSIFGLGDGIYALNGVVQDLTHTRKSLGSSDLQNAPPYLAYGLLEPRPSCFSAEDLVIQVYEQCPTPAVYSLLVGTDGVADLRDVADQCLPGKSETVGNLAQFWENDRYFTNPDALRRRLFLINRDVIQPNWPQHQLQKHQGLLPDDTTLISVRRGKTLASPGLSSPGF